MILESSISTLFFFIPGRVGIIFPYYKALKVVIRTKMPFPFCFNEWYFLRISNYRLYIMGLKLGR